MENKNIKRLYVCYDDITGYPHEHSFITLQDAMELYNSLDNTVCTYKSLQTDALEINAISNIQYIYSCDYESGNVKENKDLFNLRVNFENDNRYALRTIGFYNGIGNYTTDREQNNRTASYYESKILARQENYYND